MSSHCGKYPNCGCPPEYGTKCYPEKEPFFDNEEVKQLIEVLKQEQDVIPKEPVKVKQRNKMTHLTAKKKKRK